MPSDGEKADAHQLARLTEANCRNCPASMHVELGLNLVGRN